MSPSLVREQFSSLLGLGPEGSRQLWEGRRRCRKKSLGGITEDRVDRIYKVIEFLGLDRSLQEEGIFRKSATARKKDDLLQRLNSESTDVVRLDTEFTVHEAAAALKAMLGALEEPLLTDHCFPAVCLLGEQEQEAWAPGLRLLLQLVPGPESRLLKDLLHMLHGTAARQDSNRMCSASLATIFMTHLVCPRWLKPEELQERSGLLARVTTVMVEQAQTLFLVPPQLVAGVEEIQRRRSSQGCVTLARKEEGPGVTSLIASTVFNFVDREAVLEESSPVLTQYRINRQILDLNCLPPGAPYVSSHDSTMPL